MARVSKANRGKIRWIGLHISQMPISRAILEDNLGKIMGNINWKLFDFIDLSKSNFDPYFRKFELKPAKGPNKRDLFPFIHLVSKCGTDMGGAPTAAFP